MKTKLLRPHRIVSISALAVVSAQLALLHHGHIMMFLADVRSRLRALDGEELKGATIGGTASKLEIDFGDPATHYVVAVHRKTRSLEVGLHFEGERSENQRRLAALAERPATVRRLGAGVDLEQWTQVWTRVHHTTVLSGVDWSPKRDLTDTLARQTSQRLLRFIRVLKPMLDAKRRGVSGTKREAPLSRRPSTTN